MRLTSILAHLSTEVEGENTPVEQHMLEQSLEDADPDNIIDTILILERELDQ
jgi:hypothetical protein